MKVIIRCNNTDYIGDIYYNFSYQFYDSLSYIFFRVKRSILGEMSIRLVIKIFSERCHY